MSRAGCVRDDVPLQQPSHEVGTTHYYQDLQMEALGLGEVHTAGSGRAET